MKNQVFAIFCALFLAQALDIHAKPEPGDFQAAEVRGIADAAEKILNKLMAIVDKALDQASSTLNSSVQKVNETVIQLEGKGRRAINSAMAPINAKLKDLIGKAEKQGVDTTKCKNYIDDLNNLPNNLSDDMAKCMTDELFTATGYVHDVLVNLQVIEKNMANFANQIKNCEGHVWSEIKCLGHLTAEMAKDTIDVPVQIAADAAKTSLLVAKFIPKVTKCYTGSVAKVPIQGQEIVGKFGSCVGLQQI